MAFRRVKKAGLKAQLPTHILLQQELTKKIVRYLHKSDFAGRIPRMITPVTRPKLCLILPKIFIAMLLANIKQKYIVLYQPPVSGL